MEPTPALRGFASIPPVAWRVLLVGLVIREGFSFWTGHPYDLEVWVRTGWAVAHGTSPYLHPWPAVAGSFGYTWQPLPSAAYLPFWPGVFGGDYWLWERVGSGNPLVLYFLLKQGPILGDLAVAILLYRWVLRTTSVRAKALAALTFWSLFPYDILISSIWGQLDSVTTALLIGSLLLSEARAAARSTVWGAGVFIKWVTAIYLPFEILRQRGWRRLWPVLSIAAVGGLTLLIFLVTGWTLGPVVATGAGQSGGGGEGMNYARLFGLDALHTALGTYPWLFAGLSHLWVPATLVAGWFAARWVRTATPAQELRALLFIMTVFLLFRWGLYEQYFLYPFALLVADIYTEHPQRRQFLYYLVVVAFTFLLWNDGFTIWFANPVSPSSFAIVQSFDNSAVGGQIRLDLLDALAVLMSVSLAQLLWVLWRDEAAPKPWIFLLSPLRWVRPRPGAPPTKAPVS